LKELIGEKLAGNLPERPPEREPPQVINLMDALKRSLAEERDPRASKPQKRGIGKSRRRAEARGPQGAAGKLRSGHPTVD